MGCNQEIVTCAQASQPLSLPSHALSYHAVLDEVAANADDGLAIAKVNVRLEEWLQRVR